MKGCEARASVEKGLAGQRACSGLADWSGGLARTRVAEQRGNPPKLLPVANQKRDTAPLPRHLDPAWHGMRAHMRLSMHRKSSKCTLR